MASRKQSEPEPIRAGGHVLRESGWELDVSPRPAAADVADEHGEPATETSDAEPGTEVEQADEQPPRAECPDCGKDVAVNKDSSLRRHTCVIQAAPPHVTFDKEGDE